MKHTLIKVSFAITIILFLLYNSKYRYLFRGVSTIYLQGHTTAFLEDYKSFSNNQINGADKPIPWPLHKLYNSFPLNDDLKKYNEERKTVAYLVFKNDSILFEKYYKGFDASSKTNSFSMVKSIVSAMMGIAIQEGHIKSLDQKVIDFLPNLKGPYAEEVTIGDLSSMSSGQKWNEEYYNPFSVTSASYFVDDLNKLIIEQPIDSKPGKAFKYQSGTTQLLAMVIKKATKENLSYYLQKKLWEPLGAKEALWQLDSTTSEMEKAFCCLASNARDFARFASLYKNYGKWNGKQILDSSFVEFSLKPRFKESPEYGYGWWLDNYKGKKVFMMRGHLGQYVIIIPEIDAMVVRLGHLKDAESSREGKSYGGEPFTKDIYRYIDGGLKLIENL